MGDEASINETGGLRMTADHFDAMVADGAFDKFPPCKIELLHGRLSIMSPAGPIHDDLIEFIESWSHRSNPDRQYRIRTQCGIVADDDRPEPDVAWFVGTSRRPARPRPADIKLLIEVADSSLASDLRLKAGLYAAGGVLEYWIVDIPSRQIHVMRNADGSAYRDVSVVARGGSIAPRCRPDAVLDTAELFDIDWDHVGD